MSASRWTVIQEPTAGLLGTLSAVIGDDLTADPDMLPDMTYAEQFVAFSDYSGGAPGRPYRIFTFLVRNWPFSEAWNTARERVRRDHGLGSGEISYKTSDDRKKRAFTDYLTAAGSLPGAVLSLAIHPAISLFEKPIEVPAEFQGWGGKDYRRLREIVEFLSLWVVGLSRRGQRIVWVTDEDAIVSTNERMDQAANTLARVTSHYAPQGEGNRCKRLKVTTTLADQENANYGFRDSVSVADLVAGALADFVPHAHDVNDPTSRSGGEVSGELLKGKCEEIMGWWVRDDQPLKRAAWVAMPAPKDETNHELRVFRMDVHV